MVHCGEGWEPGRPLGGQRVLLRAGSSPTGKGKEQRWWQDCRLCVSLRHRASLRFPRTVPVAQTASRWGARSDRQCWPRACASDSGRRQGCAPYCEKRAKALKASVSVARGSLSPDVSGVDHFQQGSRSCLSAQVGLSAGGASWGCRPGSTAMLSFYLSSRCFTGRREAACSVTFLTGILLLQWMKVAARTPTGCGCSTRKPSCLTVCTGDSSRTPARRRPCGSTPAWWGRPALSGCCCSGAEPAGRQAPGRGRRSPSCFDCYMAFLNCSVALYL